MALKFSEDLRDSGTVKSWNEAKGFGFIESPAMADIFVHRSDLIGPPELTVGAPVQFVRQYDAERKKEIAKEVVAGEDQVEPSTSRRVDAFVDLNGLDEQCAALLRAQSHAVRYEVMADFTKEVRTNPHLHSDRSTFSTDVAEMTKSYAEDSLLLPVFLELNNLSADFARLLRLQPRRVHIAVYLTQGAGGWKG